MGILCRERDKEEKRMARTFMMGLILLLGLPLHIFAGQITDVRAEKKAQDEIEIEIEGVYGAYQGVGMRSPARFVIKLEGASLSEGVPSAMEVEGPIISGIKTFSRGNDVHIVLESADSARLFHCTMHDKTGKIIIKCWMPRDVATVSGDESESESALGALIVPPKKELSEVFGWPKKEEGREDRKGGQKKLAKYRGQKITLDFYKTDLHNVFRLFAEMSEKNIIIDDEVKGELTLALKEVPWDEAMDLVLDLKELVKVEKLGTTIIKPKPVKETTGKGELVVKKFSEEILQPARLLKQEKENRQVAQNMILEAHNLETLGKKEEALKRYEEALSLWKDNFDLIMKTASMQYATGRFARCYYFAGQALKLNPKNSEAALYAAISAAGMDQVADARHLFELATQSRPKIPEAFFNYGLFLKQHKDYDGALAVYQRHEQLFGPSLDVRLKMATLYEVQGKNNEACKKYSEIQKSGFYMDKKTEGVVQKKILTLCRQGEE